MVQYVEPPSTNLFIT